MDNKKFIIFCHYSIDDSYNIRNNEVVEEIKNKFGKRIEGLRNLLMSKKYGEGYVYLFIDPGWSNYIKKKKYNKVTQDGSFISGLFNGLIPGELSSQIKIISFRNLEDFLDNLRSRTKIQEFVKYMGAEKDRLLYDGPKIIEAIIRIAHVGRSIPIFRFDDDVLFGFCDKDKNGQAQAIAQLKEGIENLCNQYEQINQDSTVDYFMFSGSYLEKEKQESIIVEDNDLQTNESEFENYFLNGFATRVTPLYNVFEKNNELEWELNIQAKREFLKSLFKLGANPILQVISGAGLCMSDSAIIDLPPFSNMRYNIVWVDDHLKYSLHDELSHFGISTHHIARVDNAVFYQNRHPRDSKNSDNEQRKVQIEEKDIRWAIVEYIPRLILGCIVDMWLRDYALKLGLKKLIEVLTNSNVHENNITEIKERFGKIFEKAYDLIQDNRSPSDVEREIRKGLKKRYAESLEECVRKDDGVDREQLKQYLIESACKRLTELAKDWSRETFAGTALYYFILGSGRKVVKDCFPKDMPMGLFSSPKEPHEITQKKIFHLKEFSPGIKTRIEGLVEDFVEYAKLVSKFWPYFVQQVRWLPRDEHTLDWLFEL